MSEGIVFVPCFCADHTKDPQNTLNKHHCFPVTVRLSVRKCLDSRSKPRQTATGNNQKKQRESKRDLASGLASGLASSHAWELLRNAAVNAAAKSQKLHVVLAFTAGGVTFGGIDDYLRRRLELVPQMDTIVSGTPSSGRCNPEHYQSYWRNLFPQW